MLEFASPGSPPTLPQLLGAKEGEGYLLMCPQFHSGVLDIGANPRERLGYKEVGC